MASLDTQPKIIPARLAFLAIYNPSLGITDETFKDQVVFYKLRSKRKHGLDEDEHEEQRQEEENEKLRQIGLAQGMIGFAKSFSGGSKLDNVDTEKQRIVTYELELDWWILASIDLTRIPLPAPSKATSEATDKPKDKYEYTSRDISPPALLIQQLIRAHAVFNLHNGASLRSLYSRYSRAKFCSILDRYWSRFTNSWDISLHGLPSADIFGGMQLSAGGELGVGVGEEEWGAGEREVLEDFARRTDGLVDMVVCRYGDPPETKKETTSKSNTEDEEPWMGYGREAESSDGVVFSGLGTVSKASIRDVSIWAQSIYTLGENAYGVKDSPTSDRRKRKRRTRNMDRDGDQALPGIPRSIIASAERSLDVATSKVGKQSELIKSKKARAKSPSPDTSKEQETWKKYLLLGYGTHWGVSESTPTAEIPIDAVRNRMSAHIAKENAGQFLIGLYGDPEDESDVGSSASDTNEAVEWNRRIMVRTLHVHEADSSREGINSSSVSLSDRSSPPGGSTDKDGSPGESSTGESAETVKPIRTKQTRRVRVLIYAHRPFLYILLFDPLTAGLMMPSFYRDLHTFLSSLRPLLVRRTGVEVATARKRTTLNEVRTPTQETINEEPTWEIVHDADTHATCANMPGIEDGTISRTDALNMHSAALEILQSVQPDEQERRIKTSRGWWICWARVLHTNNEIEAVPEEQASEQVDRSDHAEQWRTVLNKRYGREILLFRKARDGENKGKSRVTSGWGGIMGASAEAGAKLEDMGIRIDPRRYIEGIMGFGRL